MEIETTPFAHREGITAPDACCSSRENGATFVGLDDARVTPPVERLKALADETRLRMLALLARQPEPLCVCEITERFPLRQPTISHHLRILREVGLIGGEKRGVWSYYWATAEGKRCLALVEAFGA